ncbi:acyl-CoA synthetase (AMP-forming)/AMP-acid ligase II [Catenulispora sp. GP43]|uniref:fatty acyl-AMP ligase n=1 Tax=Catenulispora sp. GP43 TaxID=3156263 RepID=UPI0035112B29
MRLPSGPWSTLVDVCVSRAAEDPDRGFFSYLPDGRTVGSSLTAGAVDRQARALAVVLLRHADPGDRVLLAYPPGLEFIVGFYGCLYAGMIAVPVPPVEIGRLGARSDKAEAVRGSARPKVFLTTEAALARLDGGRAVPALADLVFLASDTVIGPDAGELAQKWSAPRIEPDSVAYLQYSSGSTGVPKGVILTHRNVLHNLELIRANAFRGAPAEGERTESNVLFLPFFHDMGLVNGVLSPLYRDYEAVHLSPMAFVQRPVSWLRAISERGRAVSVAPNFAYDLAVRRIPDEQVAELDLSGWRLAGCGAEPVRPQTIDAFCEKFAAAGFSRSAFYPCYGLAESTVMVSGGPALTEPVVVGFDAERLAAGKVVPASAGTGADRVRTLVGCGQIQESVTLRIVAPLTRRVCAPDEIGEIYIAGPSVGEGYWNAPRQTAETFGIELPDEPGVPFLATGDLGFVHGGQVFVTGRRKDAIILNGLNYYPHDIEAAVRGAHPALRDDRGCAFSVDDGSQERLVVLAEVQRRYRVVREPAAPSPETGQAPRESTRPTVDASEIESAVAAAVASAQGVRVDEVVLVAAGALPYTSSAKIKRAECRSRYIAAQLELA